MKRILSSHADIKGVCYNCLNGFHSACHDPNCKCVINKHNQWWFVSEVQHEISKWCDEAFGKVKSNMRLAVRASKELNELMDELSINDSSEKAIEECADVVICLYRLANLLGKDLDAAISLKMSKNKKRKWIKDGTGCGQHK